MRVVAMDTSSNRRQEKRMGEMGIGWKRKNARRRGCEDNRMLITRFLTGVVPSNRKQGRRRLNTNRFSAKTDDVCDKTSRYLRN